MPRRAEHNPYQLPLELGRPAHEPTSVYRALLEKLATPQETSRFVRVVPQEVVVRSPADAAAHLLRHIFTPLEQLDQEELWVLLFSTRQRLTHEVLLYRGTLDSIPIRPAEAFKEAVRVNAAAILLAHNHPSGDPAPSPQDVQLTEVVGQAGILLSIPLLDHLVVGHGRWVSLREQGLALKGR